MPDPQKRIAELEAQIAELKARWPAHSAQPWMLQQLEDLEEELESLKNADADV
ncbi:MAG TPA: histidine kinase [Chloroflexi bacterium]|nr:histidine kinase [Chloroflexota bacterium]HBY08210.1 histidine kinase [Chloroflexota bacterium]